MQCVYRILLVLLLCDTSLLVTESSHITFSGFTEGTIYTYYTNGDNPITELTCVANSTDNSVTSINTTWYYAVSTDTGSSELRFENVATEVKWKQSRTYFCRAVYDMNGLQQHEDSRSIVVKIDYNTTITVSYGDTVHVRGITNNKAVPVPVMTESVAISCDAEGGEWSYTGQTGVTNPVTIDLFTIEYALTFACDKRETPSGSRRNVHSVTLLAFGSGIWLQGQDTYTEIPEAETVELIEDRTLVCVSSKSSLYTAWYYRGDTNTGAGERVLGTESEDTIGFDKLNLPKSLPANRTGYYYCTSNEYSIDTSIEQLKEHSIRISLPTDTITTPVYTTETTTTPTTTTTPSAIGTASTERTTPTTTTPTPVATTTPVPVSVPISLQLYYTPNYSVVFVGVDDVTLVCVVTTDSGTILNVSLVDTETGSILKRHTGSEAEIQLKQRVELKKGDLFYKCTVDTETGEREEQYVTIRAEDPYTQEIVNLRTDTSSDGREVLLEWDTSHPLLANETFSIWLSSLNVSSGYKRIGTTRGTEYSLVGLSDSYHYSIQVQVVSRLSSSNTSLYYVHSEREPAVSSYATIGLVVGLLLLLVLVAVVIVLVVLVVVLLLKRRKYRKSGYSKQTEADDKRTENGTGTETAAKSQYCNLSDIDTNKSPATNQLILPTNTSKKGAYKKLPQFDIPLSPPKIDPPGATGGYMSLDQLELDSEFCRKETDSGMEDIGSQNGELQYENVRDTLYQSTSRKYANDPHATLVPLSQYKDHLSHLLSEYRLEKEYRALGGQDLRNECTSAMLSVNKNKNKYKMIYPYEKSRVVLASPQDTDYINASFIPGFHLCESFIAAQAPKSNTLEDFWQLILEQRVTTIVMLTRLVELGKEKCMDYWPESPGASEQYGLLMVKLQREEQYTGYTVRDLVLTVSDNRKIKVTQFHYTAWPDHDVPQLYNNLLDFTEIVKHHRKKERVPVLVHCSAGVGRSGTFISLYNLLEAVSAGEPISVYRIVNEMREHRPQMVQTFNQYKFIYLAVLELIFGGTGIPSEDFCDNYRLYQQSQGDTYTDIFKEQFQELCYQSDCSFNYLQTAARDPSNADKNVVKDVLPYDVNRVILYSPNWPCEYINASYMEGYELVATPLPTSDTIQDFLQLVYQMEDPLVVLLFSNTEYQKVREGGSNRLCYWLEEKGKKEFDGFAVTTEKSQKSSFLIQQKMKVFSSYDSDERSFSQFISLVWEDTGAVTDIVGVLTLLEFIFKQKLTSPGKRILFCCSDGIGKSGVLLTVYTAIRGIERNKSIDVFQTVKQLRNARRNMVPTIEHYLSCYHLINEYCQMNV